MTRSRISWPKRVVIVVVGAVVLLGGSFARAIEETYGGTTPGESVQREDGTMAIYDLLDEQADRYEIQEVDESVAVVFAIPAETGELIEVYRGTHDEARAWKNAAEAETRLLVFEGPHDEAMAWEQARQDAGKNMLVPNLIVVGGVVIILAGLALGWTRARSALREERSPT